MGLGVIVVFPGDFLHVPYFLQPACRKCHSQCLFLRLGRSLVTIRVSPTDPWVQIHARVALESGFWACVQFAMYSLPLGKVVPATSGTVPSTLPSSPYPLPTWDPPHWLALFLVYLHLHILLGLLAWSFCWRHFSVLIRCGFAMSSWPLPSSADSGLHFTFLRWWVRKQSKTYPFAGSHLSLLLNDHCQWLASVYTSVVSVYIAKSVSMNF